MAKPRIPLPKQVEKVHKDKTKYDRTKASLDEVYSDEAHQPAKSYMRGLKKLQAKAIKPKE